MAEALRAAAAVFDERREQARQRQRVITANAELQERELVKLASLAAAMREALRARGVGEPAASLAAEAGIAVFKVAFERWIDAVGERGLGAFVLEGLAGLESLMAGGRP